MRRCGKLLKDSYRTSFTSSGWWTERENRSELRRKAQFWTRCLMKDRRRCSAPSASVRSLTESSRYDSLFPYICSVLKTCRCRFFPCLRRSPCARRGHVCTPLYVHSVRGNSSILYNTSIRRPPGHGLYIKTLLIFVRVCFVCQE